MQKVKDTITAGADINNTSYCVSIYQDQYYKMTDKYIL